MEFSVRNSDNLVMFSTSCKSCIPFENLESMSNSGMTFYVDNKQVSIPWLKSQFGVDQVFEEAVVDDEVSECLEVDPPEVREHLVDVSNLDFPVTSRTIICMNNGKIYRNQKEAAEILNIDINWVSYSITQKREYKGYLFKKVVDLR